MWGRLFNSIIIIRQRSSQKVDVAITSTGILLSLLLFFEFLFCSCDRVVFSFFVLCFVLAEKKMRFDGEMMMSLVSIFSSMHKT